MAPTWPRRDFHHGRFANSFHTWLEANGVTFDDDGTGIHLRAMPVSRWGNGTGFQCVIDLNTLKIAIITLIRAAGGDETRLPGFEDRPGDAAGDCPALPGQ